MSEGGDYSPGVWRGYDFNEARERYDRHVGRSYSEARSSSEINLESIVPRNLKTKSESPLVIVCDVTGSMGEWPTTIFSKLPYLELEGKQYLGDTMEVSFAAVGDAHSDKYALQVRPFTTGRGLETELQNLIIEGNGGAGKRESYELPALYYARRVEMPNAIKPVMIFIGDEAIYDIVSPEQSKKWTRCALGSGTLKSKDVFQELKRKFSVYLIKKPYHITSSNEMTADDKIIQKQWEDYLGPEKVAILPDPKRVVDVIFGLLANETSKIAYFNEELKGRQTEQQVKAVLKSLHTIHEPVVEKIVEGRSITNERVGGKEVKSLI